VVFLLTASLIFPNSSLHFCARFSLGPLLGLLLGLLLFLQWRYSRGPQILETANRVEVLNV